jgi:hypothetical protein
MKVRELIQMLSRFDGETPIVVQNDNFHSMGMEFHDFGGYPTLVVFNQEDLEASPQ